MALSTSSSQSPPLLGDSKRAGGSLGRRVQQIVSLPLDSTEVRLSLEALSSCYTTTTTTTNENGLVELSTNKRDLRTDMQEQLGTLDMEFINSLKQLDNVFRELETEVFKIDKATNELRNKVNTTINGTLGIYEQASLLVDERKELTNRHLLASEFISKFSLTDHQLQIINGNAGAIVVDQEFLDTLDIIINKRMECSKLLTIQKQPNGNNNNNSSNNSNSNSNNKEDGDKSKGINELLNELKEVEDKAFDGLLKWVIRQVRELNKTTPEFSSLLKQGIRKLEEKHRPLYDLALKEIVKIRSEVLAKSFINALVIGNEKNGTKPIELHAADPLRYVGDMLAWIHQTCAEEKELLNTLFFGSANSSASDVGLFTMDHWETKSIKELLGLTFENIARPLEIRILQTIEELNNSIVVYRIYNLLAFYNQLFAMVCPIDTLFMATMEDLHKTTYEKFQSILNLLVDNCIADFDSSVSHTLDVPDSLNALLNVVSEILFIHEDSIAFSDNRNDDSKNMDVVVEDIYKILDKILDEAHLSIQQQDKNLRDYEQTIFEHNVLHFITTQLGSPSSSSTTTTSSSSSPSSPSQSWYAKCAEREALLKDNLASQLLAILKDKSHLDFEELKGGDVADNDLVVKMIEQFNQALKGDLDISRLLIRMGSYLEARDVAQNVKGMFIEKYSGVYNTVSERLKDAADILHTPETVSTLL